ncbi:tRNA(Met) cytidine acetyltransferase TmcA [Pantoea sp. FN060301]|uniref:tRNA(Met) cytidine acetyltransferase TmcA n=1 Tax=Pantoea sp. FN060301 TaxID=3420380 RepID=UPI003D172842
MTTLLEQTETLSQQGMRRLVVVSGEAEWCLTQARQFMAWLPGDWLWLGDAPQSPLNCAPQAASTLLGREFLHAVFDARTGLHAEALAALAGTLKAGSWLLMLVPAWEEWARQPDTDALRWSGQPAATATPHFTRRLQRLIQQDKDVALLQQYQPFSLPAIAAHADWQPDDTAQQQALLSRLLKSEPATYVLIAPRGRGKSALAGLLAARWPGRALITAPAKVSTEVLAHFAGDKFSFIAPDRLLSLPPEQRPQEIDWLLIDEAAAIPAPLLHQMVSLFPRVLLTTTLQGYEGTGRGFLLKFIASLPGAIQLRLERPLRWSAEDPLERFVSAALLFDEEMPSVTDVPVSYATPLQQEWQTNPARLEAIYRLLTSAHYRTSPLDLRRMMDAPGMHFSAALQDERVVGAMWLVEEGGLSEALAEAVWAGLRRPRGNLLAQSLAAHGGFPDAPCLVSRRISRIAVAPALRRRGTGRELVLQSQQAAAGLDFLSVSFGYTEALWHFWRACGFQLVRFGSKTEASSGCHTAMALLPLSERGKALAGRASRRLVRDWPWLRMLIGDETVRASVDLLLQQSGLMRDEPLDEEDWRELAGFAWAHRPFEASIGALGRLSVHFSGEMPLLRAALSERLTAASLCQRFALSGRKALLAGWRQETQRALAALDPQRDEAWRAYMMALEAGSGG